MKTNQSSNQVRSTYSMLIRSEEKQKNVFETIACSLFILSAIAAIVQFASQPVTIPFQSVQTASTPQVQVVERA